MLSQKLIGSLNKKIITVQENFTVSRTYTFPVNATSIDYLLIRGGTGTFDSWSNVTISLVRLFDTATGPVSYATAEAQAQAEYDKFPSTTSGQTVSWDMYRYSSSGMPLINPQSGFYRTSAVKTKSGNGWGLSGTFNPGDGLKSYNAGNIQIRVALAATGATTTAFGISASGGSPNGGLGELKEAYNIPIIGGQTYSITVGSGGFVNLSYAYEE
jgi:hypothetical protein